MNDILNILPGFHHITEPDELGNLIPLMLNANTDLGWECNASAPMWTMISLFMGMNDRNGPGVGQVVLSPDRKFVAIVFTSHCMSTLELFYENKPDPNRVAFSILFPLTPSLEELITSLRTYVHMIAPIIEMPIDLGAHLPSTQTIVHRYDFVYPTEGLLSLDKPGKLGKTMEGKRQVVRRYRDPSRYVVRDFCEVDDHLATELWDSWAKPKIDDPNEGGIFLETEQRLVGSTRYHDFVKYGVPMNGTILQVAGKPEYVGMAASTQVSHKMWTMFFCLQNDSHPCSGDFLWRNEMTKWAHLPLESDGGADELNGRDCVGLSRFKFAYQKVAGGERRTMWVTTTQPEHHEFFGQNAIDCVEHDARLREEGIIP